MTEVYDFYKFQNPEEGLAGGLMYKQVERHSSTIAKTTLEKETIYLEPIIDNSLKRVTGPLL